MKTKTFEIAIASVIMIASCYLLSKSCEYKNEVQELRGKCERYEKLKLQYDTTTIFNKVKIYPKMMEISDSILERNKKR